MDYACLCLELSPSQHLFNRFILTKHCRCFDNDTRGADGAADLLQALSQSTQLEVLIFSHGNQIPAAAWQQLPDGAWPKLRMAAGIPKEELQRLQLRAEGARGRTLSTSTLEIAADDSTALAGPRRLRIAVAGDLDSDAMEFMACLSSSPIEVLDLRNCRGIPAAAWQKVRSAKWLNLKKADFYGCLAERIGWRFSRCLHLRVFICLCWKLFEFRFVNFCEVVVWVQVDHNGLKMDCIPALVVVPRCFRQIVFDKALQVLRH